MSTVALAISFDACPYVFATAGCPASVTSSDESWSSAWVIQPAMLDWPRGRTSERMGTSDAQLSVNGRTFVVRDLPLVGGPYDGAASGATHLFTRRASRFAQAALASDIALGSTTFDVETTAGFPSGDQVVWIDAEAIRASRSGNTFTVITRGYYGSRSLVHERDLSRSYVPLVWGGFPSITRRRVLLWKIVDGVASVLWRGYAQQAPTLADDGESYEIPAQHVWARLKDTRIGVSPVTTRISGWYLPGADAAEADQVSIGALLATVNNGGLALARSIPRAGELARTCKTIDELLGVVQGRLQADLIAKSVTGVLVSLSRAESGDIELSVVGPTGTIKGASLSSSGGGASTTSTYTDAGGTRTVKSTFKADQFTSAYLPLTDPDSRTRTLVAGLDTSLGFPASFARTTITVIPGVVTHQPVLRAEIDDDPYLKGYAIIFRPTAVDAATASVSGTGELVAMVREPAPLPSRPSLRAARDLRLSLAITADHWLYAIDYAIVSSIPFIRTPADTRDWSRELEERVVAATDGASALSRVRWYFDGERTFGEGITSQCRLNGCAIGVRAGGKIGVVPLRPPLPTDAPVAVFTSADYYANPSFEVLPEEVRTSAKITTGGLSVIVNDLDAEARYGQTDPIEVSPLGELEGQAQEVPSADFLASQLLRNVLGPWSEPVSLHTLTVSRDLWGEVLYQGDCVQFDSFNAPDGQGGRGLVNARGIVLSRELGEDEERMRVGVLVFDAAERIAGYAPCWRVESISGAVITVAIDYLTAVATDYSGSNLGSYRYATAGEDGGTSWCRVGYKLALITRDAITQLVQGGLVVTAYNPAARTITLTASVPTGVQDWAAAVASGDPVDLVFDVYSVATAAQREFAYVGSESTAVIDGTTDTPNRWAP